MLKVVLIIGIIIVALFIVLLMWSCCVVAGRSDRRDEELSKQIDVSFHYEEDTIGYILNSYNKYNSRIILNNGQIDYYLY